MKSITASNYTKDALYPGIAKAISEILKTEASVSPVAVLLKTQRLTPQLLEDWRFGRIPYLERVLIGSLGKMSRILRIFEQHSRSLGLVPIQTEYRKFGRGKTRIVLRFSKSHSPAIEAAYSRHYFKPDAAEAERTRLAHKAQKQQEKQAKIAERRRLRAMEDDD